MTPAPGRIRRVVSIDLPRPRRRVDLLVDRRYQEYVVELEQLIETVHLDATSQA